MSSTGCRYKDVLFALAVAETYNKPLGKLQLQKYLYLVDVLSPLWDLVSAGGYQTYFHGPYNQAVQNAVDVLAFRGAVDIVHSSFISSERIKISYQISPIGVKIVDKLRQEEIFNRRFELFLIIGRYVDERGWSQLRNMVYSEATYVSSKYEGLGQKLFTDSILTNESLQILYGFYGLIVDEKKITRTNMIFIFFKLLDNYQLLINQ